MNNELNIRSITAEFKNILLKTQKDLKARDERFKKHKNVYEMNKREYQTLYKENLELKKRLEQYESYYKNQQKQKGAKIYCSVSRENLKTIGEGK